MVKSSSFYGAKLGNLLKMTTDGVCRVLAVALAEIACSQSPEDPISALSTVLRKMASIEGGDYRAESTIHNRAAEEKCCRGTVDALLKLLTEVEGEISQDTWDHLLNSFRSEYPMLSWTAVAFLDPEGYIEGDEKKPCIRYSSASNGAGQMLLSVKEVSDTGLLWSLFDEESKAEFLNCQNVFDFPKALFYGEIPRPGAIFAAPIIYDSVLSSEAVAFSDEPLPAVPKKLAFVASSVGGSGEGIPFYVQKNIIKLADCLSKTLRRSEENLVKKQAKYLAEEKIKFADIAAQWESAEQKYPVAKKIIEEWESFISMFSDLSVVGSSGEATVAALIFSLAFKSADQISSRPGVWRWDKLRNALIDVKDSIKNFQPVTGQPRLGLLAEHRLKYIQGILPGSLEGASLGMEILHSFVTEIVSLRAADVAKRREALNLAEGQRAEDIDNDFEN